MVVDASCGVVSPRARVGGKAVTALLLCVTLAAVRSVPMVSLASNASFG